MIALGDGARLRRAEAGDLDAVLAIERALPMPRAAPGAAVRSGGFLLDNDATSSRELLAAANTWLLEVDGEPVGFALTLGDPVLRASPLWTRRERIQWRPPFDPEAALARRIAYFDKLAVLPAVRSRYWGAALALRALAELIDEHEHELVLTTTLIEPVVNRAALPYLARVGARAVGQLDETYPAIGPIRSAIHVIEAERYREHIGSLHAASPPATRRLIDASLA